MTATLETLREQMRSCLEAGDVETAADACLRGLRQYPRWVEGHRFLGEINLNQDALDAARRCFELVAAAEPDNATPYVGIGVVLEHQQRFSEAVVAFERALDLDQTDNEVRQELVRLYEQVGSGRGVQTTRAALAHQHVRGHMLRQAEREIDGLLAAEATRLDLMLARARVAWLNGNADAAERAARAVLELSPDCVLANLIAAEALTRADRPGDAAPFLVAVGELDPEAELTSAALQGLLAEGVTVAHGLPLSHQVVRVDMPHEDLAAGDPPTETLAEADEAEEPAVASADPESPQPADGEPWMSTPLELNVQRVASPVSPQAGMLDSLLKDLDQVWPERLDLDQGASKQTAAAVGSSAALTELAPTDDEDLPPSFLGDVSEVIREFEDPADHYDLFVDLPSRPNTLSPGEPGPAPSAAGSGDPDRFDFAAELAASQTRALAPVEEPTLSGQHAIIDLSTAVEAGWDSGLPGEQPLAGVPAETVCLQASERAAVDSPDDRAEATGWNAAPDSPPGRGVATTEASGWGERAVVDADAVRRGRADLGLAPGVGAPTPAFDLLNLPSPTEDDLADLLGGVATDGASDEPPATNLGVAPLPEDDVAAGAASLAGLDDGDVAGSAPGGPTRDASWAGISIPRNAPSDLDGSLIRLAAIAPPELGPGTAAGPDGNSSARPHGDASSPERARSEIASAATGAMVTPESDGNALGEVEAALIARRYDPAWKQLQTVVRERSTAGAEALELLARYDGGSRGLRLQVTGDALMAAGKYWEALAKYAEALDSVRTPAGAR